MRREMGYTNINNMPQARNPGLLLLDIQRGTSMLIPLLQMYVKQLETDINFILKNGPRKMPNGGKFYHQNRDFFEAFKKGGLENANMIEMTRIIEQINEGMQDKNFKKFIETTIEGAKWGNEELREGITNPGVMHYLSSRDPSQVIIEEMNAIPSIDILVGYSMHNCLKVIDLMRYHSNPDARIYLFWLDGAKVGMSYDLMLQRHGTKEPSKDPLIDSIELSDQFCKTLQKFYGYSNKEKAHESRLTADFVKIYLKVRAQHSKNGIYVLPESNNFHVKQAMSNFIKSYNGEPVLGYEGNRVNTDTDFKRMPYWIDKSKIMDQVQNVIFDTTGKVLSPDANTDTINPLLTKEANEQLNSQVKRILRK